MDATNTQDISAEANRLLIEEPNSYLVQIAKLRAAQPHPYGLPKSIKSELCHLLWERDNQPLSNQE